jgi:hypothetical protein
MVAISLAESIKMTRELEQRMKELGIYSNSLYNLDHIERDGKHIISACQHWSWDFLVGEGKTLDEALKSLKVVVNMYDKKFEDFRVKYTIPVIEIVASRKRK